MATPAFGSAGAVDAGTVTSGAAWDPACPASVDPGDILIAHISCRDLVTDPVTPTGWVQLTLPISTTTGRHWLFGKIADGTEDGAAVSFGIQAVSVNRSGRIYRFIGNDWTGQNILDMVLGFASASGTVAAVADQSVTTPRANCLALNFIKVDDNNTIGPFTGETGGDWTEPVAEASNNLGTGWMAQLQTAQMASAGTINGGSVTMSAADPWSVIGCYIREPIPTLFGAVSMPITFGKSVAGDIKPPKSTTVGRISLESGSIPEARTDHAIKVLARVIGGAGTIRAALYEGATNRSGDLESEALTGSLVEYTLPISEANANNITDYSALELRFWGYSAVGDAATFEIDKLWLNIPPASGPATYFGASTMPITFGKAVAASRKTFGQVILPITFGKEVSGRRYMFGQVALPIIFGKEVVGQRKTFGQLLSPFIFGKAVAGQRTTFGQTAFPITVGIATAGFRVGNTFFGVVSLPITFGENVNGARTAFGQVALPLTFTKDVVGRRTTFGQVSLPIIFTKEAIGEREVFGQLSMQTLFDANTSGLRETFSQIALPIVFDKVVTGRKQTFGQVTLPITFEAFVDGFGFVGPKTLYGEVDFDIAFLKDTVAFRKTFGQVTAPFILGSATRGRRTTFGAAQLPMDLLLDVESGSIETFGEVSLPIIFDINSAGIVRPVGVILNLAEMIYLGEEPVVAVYTQNQQIWP